MDIGLSKEEHSLKLAAVAERQFCSSRGLTHGKDRKEDKRRVAIAQPDETNLNGLQFFTHKVCCT